ncbi:MAG: YraN family protein [Proteobacteria bacterium]|nr:YraN family protein [Pseudomonadota bacterium]
MHLRSNPKKRAYLRGRWGEKIAAFYLRMKGYSILENRFKTPVGEIDLLARKGKILVAVEVKRRSTHEEAAFALSSFQKKRIERAFLYYLTRYPSSLDLRFDVVLISSWKWPCHIQGAWTSQ